ncbi:hypothetical protein BAY61_25230 [Prauserella marina]|uniref:Uncharacterized protein n=1 Tax=Prauserella marina TaxID=530584 RepID=A0A222VV00_9PSEU|nr:hypothetical protein BAY61_25230 [Prauserella marina]PWV75705.1 hypothetical protein DES30_106323 [Prauserella marina]SDD28291.1 hypothetical protein SAMN05421630_107118 [Prauserella marina]
MTTKQHPWCRHRGRALRAAGILAVLGIVAFTLHDRIPAPADVVAALATAAPAWLLAAAGAEFVSMAMFARQQRRLLTAFGVTMPRRRLLALAYSRSAIAVSFPAGSLVSAAYAFRAFRRGGADRGTATTVMVLSGLLSVAGLAVLYGSGAFTTGMVRLADTVNTHPVLPAVGVVAIGWVAFSLVATYRKHTPRRRHRSWAWLGATPFGTALTGMRTVAPRHWLLALAAATANWLTDLLCLLAVVAAFGIELSVFDVAAVYLTGQLLRQIPLTPGGIGVIEVVLLTGLVSAGAAEPAAAAAVLAYRLLSCWLIIPIGMLTLLVSRLRGGQDVVTGSLLDEFGRTGEGTTGFAEHGGGVGPRGYVREQQSADTGSRGELTGLPSG